MHVCGVSVCGVVCGVCALVHVCMSEGVFNTNSVVFVPIVICRMAPPPTYPVPMHTECVCACVYVLFVCVCVCVVWGPV